LVRLHRQANDIYDAAQCLERLFAASADAEFGVLGLDLADTYKELGDVGSTLRTLERCLEADPAAREVRSRLDALYRSEESWEPLARLLAAGAQFEETPERQADVLHTAAELATTRLEDPARAADLLAEACRLQPDNRQYLLELCDAYSASGRGGAAIEVLQKIVQSYGKRRSKELGEIHLRLAKAYLSEENVARALEELDNAFRIEPGNVGVLKLLGEVAMQAGDHKKAQQVFRALLLQRLDETSVISKAEVFMRLGQIHAELQEIPKAIQMLERAVQTDGALEPARALLEELRARSS
jgi:tetratricopeptide (TPR) repeat protein